MRSSTWPNVSDRRLYLKAAEELRPNSGQWAAYESEGHCVVIAGPGSGKTKTLTTKLARILSEDVQEPRGVACITYNNECARELEQRLDALGIEPGGRVFIGTVHSFSLTQIILPYAKVAGMGLPGDFQVATLQEQRGALERAYDRVIARGEDPHRFWRLRMDRYRRSHLKRDTAAFREQDAKCAELVVAYEEELRRAGLIDFDDMPLLSVRALREHQWLQDAIKAKYPVLIVDEYQDLGSALHQMVMGLCFSTGIRLFAVGDVDQSIYGFTGANPVLLERLSQREDVETVRLRLNYRCGSKIVTASQYALGEERDYEAPEGAEEGTVFFHPVNGNYDGQAGYVFDTLIPDAMARLPDLRLGEVAILYPAAWIGDAVANAAQARGYATIRADGNAIYPRSSRLMRWLEQCGTWCCEGWKSGNPRFSRLIDEGCRVFAESLTSEESRLDFQRALMRLLWEHRENAMSLHDWLLSVRHEILRELFAGSRTLADESDTLDAFILKTAPGGANEEMTLGQFCGHGEGNNRINLTTLHSSKGREFRLVVMFGMDDGRIPRPNPNERETREARRLFYVGFTRAEEEIHMLHSANNPSPFVIELAERLEE
ncbi:DNA helicase-2 / ATP-dependent DNA helicase PcrA [Roseibaca calidilacus]|uniref:DNA 3'-5' helicase n=1 Tax=Roseibaca calidilacus TaxID=1666912 RepID=A0ABM9VQI3_9RHOB|nr:DNA helicase-2 / ATP-dependent DNA helicase PcrA [Roseibaca calidilacus]